MPRWGSGAMKISYAVQNYTDGKRITLRDTFGEVQEFFAEVVKLNRAGMREEWQDVGVFFQCWLYWRFRIDGEHWKWTNDSWNKFTDRVRVWRDIYEYVGLPRNSSNFCGNYKKKEKVIKQLAKFNIGEPLAEEAFERIVR